MITRSGIYGSLSRCRVRIRFSEAARRLRPLIRLLIQCLWATSIRSLLRYSPLYQFNARSILRLTKAAKLPLLKLPLRLVVLQRVGNVRL